MTVSPELSSEFLAPAWMDEAACKGMDRDDTFFEGYRAKKYTAVCEDCPVRGDCLDYALIFDCKGVWGGMTEYQRNRKFNTLARATLKAEYFDY